MLNLFAYLSLLFEPSFVRASMKLLGKPIQLLGQPYPATGCSGEEHSLGIIARTCVLGAYTNSVADQCFSPLAVKRKGIVFLNNECLPDLHNRFIMACVICDPHPHPVAPVRKPHLLALVGRFSA